MAGVEVKYDTSYAWKRKVRNQIPWLTTLHRSKWDVFTHTYDDCVGFGSVAVQEGRKIFDSQPLLASQHCIRRLRDWYPRDRLRNRKHLDSSKYSEVSHRLPSDPPSPRTVVSSLGISHDSSQTLLHNSESTTSTCHGRSFTLSPRSCTGGLGPICGGTRYPSGLRFCYVSFCHACS